MLSIRIIGDPLLKKHSALVPEVDQGIQDFVKAMFEAMYRGKGIGLAAVQVGELLRIFITHVSDDGPRVFINPEIVETSVEQEIIEEGCLSIPGMNADVLRPSLVRIQAWNEKGKPFVVTAEKLLGRVVQHEFDHLNGILFVDRLESKKRERLLKTYNDKVRV